MIDCLRFAYLHDAGDALNELHGRNRLLVGQEVILRQLARSPDEETVVGTHAAVNHADVLRDLLDLADGMFIVQNTLLFFLRRHDDAIGGFDAHRGCACEER